MLSIYHAAHQHNASTSLPVTPGQQALTTALALHPTLNDFEQPPPWCNQAVTRMWANAQRDGRPAEHRWRPLFNAAKFG